MVNQQIYTMFYYSSVFGQCDRTFYAASLQDATEQAEKWLAMPHAGHPNEVTELQHVGMGVL